MKLKSLNIGRLTIYNNIVLAPMAGYTDYAFRSLATTLGAGLCVTEMVSAKGLIYKNENTRELLTLAKNEQNTAVQLFGREPDILRRACESEYLNPFEIVDINMGCPVTKIYSNGEGSRLMEEPDLAERIVKECVKSGKIITVKFRAGIVDDNLLALDFAKRMEQAGASLITIHGRTKVGLYSGKVHFDEIARVKKAVQIPVIANGGIFTEEDANYMLEATGADGVGLARGCLSNPLLFATLSGTKTSMSIKDCVFYLMDLRKQNSSDVAVAHAMRTFCAQMLKGVRGGKEAKLKIFQAESTEEIKQILNAVM